MKLDRRKIRIIFLSVIFNFLRQCESIILSGAPNSYARYPKWAHSFENSLSLEIKTKQSNGLVLYTDDGGVQGNFYALTIADGRIQLDFRLGDNTNDQGRRPVNTIRIEEVRVDDNRWHTLNIFQSWENVKLELDQTLVFKILYQRSFVFGNLLKNSDVYIGGIPADIHLMSSMSSPLRRHSQHLAANIRNLVYRLYPQGVTSPQLLDAFGTRLNEEDYCKPIPTSSRESFVCRNGGECYSTNDGAKCDCSMSDYEGIHCDIEKPDAELSFFGEEWIGYDVSNVTSGPVRTKRELISLVFKTVHGEALLFFTGDQSNFLQLSIEDGAIHSYSKFDGTDKRMIRMFNAVNNGRYDDDLWHTVVVERSLQMMILTVDGQKDEIRQYAPESDWITNAFAYLGGLPKEKTFIGIGRQPFRGCMKKVKYQADSQQLLFVNIADRGYGESVIRTGGELAFSCKNPQVPPDILSFNTNPSFIKLPKWNSMASGSISFHFRTSEPDGLLLYHGDPTPKSTDYVAFELIDSHLYLIINLGSGNVRLQTTSKKVTEGGSLGWHSVVLERVGRAGSVVVDSMKTDFNTPGVSANLIVDDSIYIGGVPFNDSQRFHFPSSVWSITLRKGFVGCIKNVRINGISAKLSTSFEQQNSTGVSLGCPTVKSIDFCNPNPCQNYGSCENGYSTFKCDCSSTNMEGPTCADEPTVVTLEGDHPVTVVLPTAITSEAESIEIRFKTDIPRGVLLDTKSVSNRTHRSIISLLGGELELYINFGHGKHTFNWGHGLHDNRWHILRVKRRGEKLLLYLDGKWERSYFLPAYDLVVEIDELSIGQSIHSNEDTSRVDEPFKGQMSKLMFNDLNLLEKLRKDGKLGGETSKEGKGQRNVKTKIHSISFTNNTGFVTFPQHRINRLRGDYRISLKFQTLSKNSLIFSTANKVSSTDSVSIELHHGRIRYSYQAGSREESITSPILSIGHHLSDMRWHTLLIYQDPRTGEHLLLVDNTTTVLSRLKHHKAFLAGTAYLGGFPPSSPIPGRLASQRGFRGCISTLKLGDESIDIWEESDKQYGVTKGCPGPIAKCSPSACNNGGRCIQQWNSIRCECALTGYSGTRCQDASTTYLFPSSPSIIYYEYNEGERPSTDKDFMVLTFKTTQFNGVLLGIECAADRDYLTIYLKGGILVVQYNLGSRDHIIQVTNVQLNDDTKHVVKISRVDANITVVVDKQQPVRYRPRNGELVTLNMQWRVSLGAVMNNRHMEREEKRQKRQLVNLFDSFQGEIGGVNFNGLMVLDLLANGHPNVKSVGGVKQLHLSPVTMLSGEDIMSDQLFEGATSALIESIGPGCLTIEEQDNCLIDPEPKGFFTPLLPPTVTAPRRVSTARTPNSGESRWLAPTTTTPPPPTTTTTTTTRRQTTTIVLLTQTTEKMETPKTIYLSNIFPEDEGSGIPDSESSDEIIVSPPLQNTPATTTSTTVATTTTAVEPEVELKSTVLPRPYESVKEAMEKNPDYAGSIWNQAQEVPEFVPTGPAWSKARNGTRVAPLPAAPVTTRLTTTESPTTKKARMTTMRPTMKEKTTSTTVFPTPPHAILTTTTKGKSRGTNPFTVYAVRPTTPMGVIATTMKPQTASSEDFPRTLFISIGSLSVICALGLIVFCVFRCRQHPPPADHYPMVCNGKSSNGYAPISTEMSPQMIHDSASQPLISPRIPQVNGYQPLKGSVIPNGNGVSNGHNGNMNGGMKNGNGNGVQKNGNLKKKDFKEWYV